MKAKDDREEKYLFAIVSSLTRGGGHVTTATGGFVFQGRGVVRASDIGIYQKQNEVVVTDGTELALVTEDRPADLFDGSPTNGNRVTKMLQGDDGPLAREDKWIPRQSDPARMPPQRTKTDRGHNHA